ncbi:unnamed protein product [Ostreobium quekettii]|uniref:Sulfotransferase domain-containing protein n=1 Tax=Ostreobium quekettii TaxID=121088 RepID=A0A8S1J525_9CHLO|nr:unnamed protein product [Ostreobium quekettii]|eukprot:evm.model.scf_1187.1 EVM.evm.TU.scf_1187.1   scf_1187:4704-6680(+)
MGRAHSPRTFCHLSNGGLVKVCALVVIITVWVEWQHSGMLIPNSTNLEIQRPPQRQLAVDSIVVDDKQSWTRYDHPSAYGTHFDPTVCHPRVWSLDSVGRRPENTTFAFAVTKLSMRYTNIVLDAAKRLRVMSSRPISVMVLKSGAKEGAIGELAVKLSDISNTTFYLLDNPVNIEDLSEGYVRALQKNPNCCKESEYLKLHAVALPYDQVLVLDLDATLVKPVDHLFHCDVDLLYAAGPWSPLNGGVFLVRGNRPDRLRHMVEVLINTSYTYTQEACFDGLGCGPCNCGGPCSKYNVRCFGQEGPQGFIHYYFVKRGDPSFRVARISTCLYDFQDSGLKKCKPEFERRGFSPFIVHKDTRGENGSALALIRRLGTDPSTQPESKVCRPEFWILGARKAGTTALYTWLTYHPQVFSHHVQGFPTDGEIYGSVKPLDKYNNKFKKVPSGLLVGDSNVYRLIDDAAELPALCGHKHAKFLVLLRDPVERCHSQMLMRARVKQKNLDITMDSNLSEVIDRQLKSFEDAVAASPGWADGFLPEPLHGWKSSYNCIYEGIYGAHLKRWFFHTSLDNFRIYFTEDFAEHRDEVLHDALEFIGADVSLYHGSALLEGKIPNSRSNMTLPEHQQLMPLLRRRLQDVFAPYNRMLEDVIGRRTPWGY